MGNRLLVLKADQKKTDQLSNFQTSPLRTVRNRGTPPADNMPARPVDDHRSAPGLRLQAKESAPLPKLPSKKSNAHSRNLFTYSGKISREATNQLNGSTLISLRPDSRIWFYPSRSC